MILCISYNIEKQKPKQKNIGKNHSLASKWEERKNEKTWSKHYKENKKGQERAKTKADSSVHQN